MIVKCSHCRQMLSEDGFNSHECDVPISSVKIIEVAYFRDDSIKGKSLMTGRGLDGILYTFEVVPRKPIPITIPFNRRKVTDFETDDKGTES